MYHVQRDYRTVCNVHCDYTNSEKSARYIHIVTESPRYSHLVHDIYMHICTVTLCTKIRENCNLYLRKVNSLLSEHRRGFCEYVTQYEAERDF